MPRATCSHIGEAVATNSVYSLSRAFAQACVDAAQHALAQLVSTAQRQQVASHSGGRDGAYVSSMPACWDQLLACLRHMCWALPGGAHMAMARAALSLSNQSLNGMLLRA